MLVKTLFFFSSGENNKGKNLGSSPTDVILPLFPGKNKGNYVFASVRAGDVNGYDSLLLCTTYGSAWRREGPGDRCYEVDESQLTDSQTYILF